MPVVAVDPGDQLRESLGGVLVEPSIGPFADSGLDKPFGLAVGAWCVDARKLFDVDMQQVAGGGMLVAKDGNGWFERANGVQFQAGQDAADGGPAQASGLRDSHAGPALATQLFDVGGRFGGSATR